MNNLSSGNKNIIDIELINKSIMNVINNKDFNCYSSPKGIRELRIRIADFLYSIWDYKPSYENMLISNGSQQSINIIIEALIKEEDTILIEQPTYYEALDIFKRKNCNIVGININDDGIDINELKSNIIEYKPKFIYVVPTFNNPTGHSWSLENRLKFLKIINKYNITVIEDDPYSLLNYTNEEYPSLYKLNDGNNIIYLGTFSKYISPSINVGYIIAKMDYIKLFYKIKESFDLGTSLFIQYIILDYLTNNDLIKLIKNKIPKYKKLLKSTLKYLDNKNIKYIAPKGGIFVFTELNNNQENKNYYLNSNNKYSRINICYNAHSDSNYIFYQ